MKKKRLKNKFLKYRNKDNKSRYSKQRNKKYEKRLLQQLIITVTDNKTFWKTINPFLSDKIE